MFSLAILSFLAIVMVYAWSVSTKRRLPPLPPGPPAKPFIGHLLLIPPQSQEDLFYQWGKQYGDVIHVHFLGRSLIVLNSLKAATDLLEKRSRTYSDRPRLTVYELMGWSHAVAFMRYGEAFKRHRRIFQQSFDVSKCVPYQAAQTREARILLQNLLVDYKAREHHITRFSIAIIMQITYGYHVTSDSDAFLALSRDTNEAMRRAGLPGATPIDLFPFLEHFPSWFPGTYYATVGRENRKFVDATHRVPFEYVQCELAKGTAVPSLVATQLEEKERLGPKCLNSDEDIMSAGASVFVAGTETTWSTISTFIYAMLAFPMCQIRAQQEIDSIIGSERLPEFDDRKDLPYVEAILQETLRWHTSVPLGIPHRCMEDDVYRGMLIPKGSLVISNIRAINLDDTIYADPHTFNPARFLPRPEGNEEPYPSEVFGFGRRICPGRYFAADTVWIAIVSILAAFDIKRSIREDGTEIEPDINAPFIGGISSHPPTLPCDILPRSEKARLLIIEANSI